MPPSFTRTLRMKVRREAYAWLNAAALEVNMVFNYCNETSLKAATRTDNKRKWLSGFDLCYLTAGATQYFDKIGADTIQSICTHYAQKRQAGPGCFCPCLANAIGVARRNQPVRLLVPVRRSDTWTRSGYSEPHSRLGRATHHSRCIPMILQSTRWAA
jgi:hypothetical protein